MWETEVLPALAPCSSLWSGMFCMARSCADRRVLCPILSLGNPEPPQRLQASFSWVSKKGQKENTRRWHMWLPFLLGQPPAAAWGHVADTGAGALDLALQAGNLGEEWPPGQECWEEPVRQCSQKRVTSGRSPSDRRRTALQCYLVYGNGVGCVPQISVPSRTRSFPRFKNTHPCLDY